MKIVGLIPYWDAYDQHTKSDSVPPHSFKRIADVHILNYVVEALNKVRDIHDTIIYASNSDITSEISASRRFTFVKRPETLDRPDVKITDIIAQFFQEIEADVVVLAHPKCPFLTAASIQDCVDKVTSGAFDSAIIGETIQQFAWFQEKPLNYAQDNIPHLKHVDPIFIERSALYVFSRQSFQDTNSRIGRNPYFKSISNFEGLVVSNQDDYEMAEVIVNSGLYQG